MKILIIDIETTGFLYQNGRIVEIGIVELCLKSGEKKIIFDKVINPEIEQERICQSWIVRNEYMSIAEILKGVKFDSVKDEIQDIINTYTDGATAYNRSFDFDFLKSYGIKFGIELSCPMKKATGILKLPGKNGFGYKWPNANECYLHFFPNSNYIEKHRGADDALHEAEIIFELHKIGEFLN